MSGYQRILVVSTAVGDDELRHARADVRPDALVLTAPTAEAKQVVDALGVEPQPEALLAPVSSPGGDRGHRLDQLVRAEALDDRFRDVVVVTDTATATLLLRVLAPDQLFNARAVTVVGLPRGDRPADVRRGLLVGVAVGAVAGLVGSRTVLVAVPALLVSVGLVLLLVSSWRHVARELLLAAPVAFGVSVAVIAGSARFPAGF